MLLGFHARKFPKYDVYYFIYLQANCEPLVKRQKSAKTPKKPKEPAEEAPPVLKTEKKTHKEKLKMRRKKERQREEMKKNIFKKSQDEILR